MNAIRKIRLQNAIKDAVSTIFRRSIDDPRLGFITITDVEITKDDRYALIYYSVLGSQSQREKTSRVLSASSKRIMKLLFKTLDTRRLPLIRFKFDETPSKAEKLEQLLRESQGSPDDKNSSSE
ncbi:MAG: 30S ribosome-binding factor RbfA [Caldisericia bacterium]|nr:30S ribosome-binding factor RbfA [Caldisericia bacterium]